MRRELTADGSRLNTITALPSVLSLQASGFRCCPIPYDLHEINLPETGRFVRVWERMMSWRTRLAIRHRLATVSLPLCERVGHDG